MHFVCSTLIYVHHVEKIIVMDLKKNHQKQAIDSIQNSSGKPNRDTTSNWEIKLPDKGQLLNRLQCSGLR